MAFGISPPTWGRLLVRTAATFADLHIILPMVFAWRGEQVYLHCIRGRLYLPIDQWAALEAHR